MKKKKKKVNTLAAKAKNVDSNPTRASPFSLTQISVSCENTENMKI
jgi:hypothetical protein